MRNWSTIFVCHRHLLSVVAVVAHHSGAGCCCLFMPIHMITCLSVGLSICLFLSANHMSATWPETPLPNGGLVVLPVALIVVVVVVVAAV